MLFRLKLGSTASRCHYQILQTLLLFPKLSLPQLPVPVFLPVTPDSPDPSVKSTKKRIQPDPFEGELTFKSQDERNEREDGQEDRAVTKEGQGQEIHVPKGKTSDEHEGK